MVVNRALRLTGCTNCRSDLLSSFTAVAGLSRQIPRRTARLAPQSFTPRIRLLSKIHNGEHSSPEVTNQLIKVEEVQEAVDGEGEREDAEDGTRSSKAIAIPWYLEVNATQIPPQPLSERVKIPDLPESPPTILEPLLQQLSIDLGLDSLTILDLRRLDPPPALGANLIMILGTARSEKHLHVSADRSCRWLRSTYKLRPDADGLLGRNELKLKLKRIAKRTKLIGKTTADNGDDGVRTGWVCVDVGVVDGAEESLNSVAEPEEFLGFGRRTDGVRIVVQMMTEGKREEMDLEKLWTGILKRGVPAENRALEEVIRTSKPCTSTTQHVLTDGSMRIISKAPSFVSQSRGFHTSARYFLEEAQASKQQEESTSNGRAIMMDTRKPPTLKEIQEFVALAIGSGRYEKATEYLLQHQRDIPELQDEGWRRLLLTQLRFYLESAPQGQALLELGDGPINRVSTAFLRCFYQSLAPSPSIFEGDMLIWLHSFARQLDPSKCRFNDLMSLVMELQRNGVEVSTDAYLDLLRSVLQPVKVEGPYHGPPRYKIEGASKILQAMYDRGHNVLTEDVFVTLQEAAAPLPDSCEGPSTYTSSSETFDLPSIRMSAIQRRIHVLMKSIDMPTFRAESRLRLLDLYSRQNNWLEFWDIWRLALRQGQPQTAPLYAFMFKRIAETTHQKACINVLRTWVQDVEREVPAVPLKGEVARAVKACLMVADPFVERDVSDPKATGEWISIWRKCSASDK